MVRLSHGPAKYSEETVDSKLKRRREGEGSSPSAAIKYRRRLVRAHRSERRLSLVWIRAANWLGLRGIQLRVLRAGRAVNDTAQKARAVTRLGQRCSSRLRLEGVTVRAVWSG